MSSTETTSNSFRIRLSLFLSGAVLWVLVAAIGVYALVKSKDLQQTATGGQPAGALFASQKTSDADKPEPIVVTPQPANEQSASPWDSQGVADFEFTERSGREITKQDLLGQPWAVSFIFTRCQGTCPAISMAMARLQQEVKDLDVRLVSITVDPKYDTPERLRDYAEGYGADADQWLFLSGDEHETYQLIQKSFKMPVKEMVGPDRKPGYEVLHSNNVLLVDAGGRVLEKYDGRSPVDMAKLRQALQREAGPENSSGSPKPSRERSVAERDTSDPVDGAPTPEVAEPIPAESEGR